MAFSVFATRATHLVATGLAGAVALEGIKKIARAEVARAAAVGVTAWGLRGVRATEAGAERTRLTAADILSEARERIGEESPAPGAGMSGGHDHDH